MNVEVRPLGPHDADRFERMYGRMSTQSRYRRYLSVHPRLPKDRVRLLVDADGSRHVALAALHGDELVAVARYIRLRPTPHRAEVAVEVEDAWQRKGLARMLLTELTAHAEAAGIEAFTATMSRENVPVLSLLRSIWPAVRLSYEGPLAEAVIPLNEVARAA